MNTHLSSTESATLQAAALRQKAEETLLRQHTDRGPVAREDARRLHHELEVHQIELEMQNEELRRVQVELEASQARYFDLYDLAPVGYCTLSEQGLILNANLTAAILFGLDKRKLRGQILSRFILKEDQNGYYLHRKKLFEMGEQQAWEMRMVKKDGTAFWAHLTATAAQGENGGPVCRIVMSDITEMKKTRESLQKALSDLHSLHGILPICAWCKKIRNDEGYWSQVEVYLREHTEANFSHGICPECAKKVFHDFTQGACTDQEDGGRSEEFGVRSSEVGRQKLKAES